MFGCPSMLTLKKRGDFVPELKDSVESLCLHTHGNSMAEIFSPWLRLVMWGYCPWMRWFWVGAARFWWKFVRLFFIDMEILCYRFLSPGYDTSGEVEKSRICQRPRAIIPFASVLYCQDSVAITKTIKGKMISKCQVRRNRLWFAFSFASLHCTSFLLTVHIYTEITTDNLTPRSHENQAAKARMGCMTNSPSALHSLTLVLILLSSHCSLLSLCKERSMLLITLTIHYWMW